jgi:transcriptional regulator with XRE-family HTH domain
MATMLLWWRERLEGWTPVDALTQTDAQFAFGAQLRMLRRSKGMSMRALTGLIGLSAHSNLADYECGRRLPPRDVVEACERALGVANQELLRRWEATLRERSQRDSVESAINARPDAPSTEPRQRSKPGWTRALLLAVAVAALLAGWGLRSAGVTSNDNHASVVVGVSSCDTTARIVDTATLATEPRAGRASLTVGTVSLRFSPSCGLAWTRFIPAQAVTPGASGVELSVHRVDDGAVTVLRLPQVVGAESDPLLTVPGCVYAQVSVPFADGTVATARTSCRTG